MVGLTPRALATWAGTDRLSELSLHRARLARLPITKASARLAAFVAGVDVPRHMLGDVPADFVDGDRATVALLPLGNAVLVCDRADAPLSRDLACWPDDSSYHLAKSIPGKFTRWLDLGTGSGFAPLARPEVAKSITAIELNPRAAGFARRGATLAGIPLTVEVGDLARAAGRYDLVTCNAPIPTDGITRWRHTDDGFFDRLWQTCLRCAADVVVVHAVLPALLAMPAVGARVIVAYTPEGALPGFGVLWWRPHASEATAFARRLLTVERPHLDARDLDAVLPSVAAWGGCS